MHCTTVAPDDISPLTIRAFTGFGDPAREVQTSCFFRFSLVQPISSPLEQAISSVNAPMKAAAGCFWIVRTPAKGDGAAWLTAAIEIRLASIIGVKRPWSRAFRFHPPNTLGALAPRHLADQPPTRRSCASLRRVL